MRALVLIVLTALLALGLHTLLDWRWVLAAAVLGGFAYGRGGTAVGLLGLVLETSGLLLWNFLAYADPVGRLAVTLAAMSQLPLWSVPLWSLGVSAVLGGLGGGLGASLRQRIAPIASSGGREFTKESKA